LGKVLLMSSCRRIFEITTSSKSFAVGNAFLRRNIEGTATMLTRNLKHLLASVSTLFLVGSTLGCSSRATDCHWNETCESSAGAGGAAEGGKTSGTAGINSNTGGTSGGRSGRGGSSSATEGGGTTASTTSVPPCSRDLDDENACPITSKYAVFVAPPLLGDDTNGSGTESEPFATLTKALSVAVVEKDGVKRSVYVCGSAGSFSLTTTLTIVDGVSIYGGLNCADKADWTYNRNSPLVSDFVSNAPLASKLENISIAVKLKNLRITAAEATEPSGSSIAMLVVNSPEVTLQNVELIAQEGAAGKNGTSPENPGVKGEKGKTGIDACSEVNAETTLVPGADFIQTICGSTISSTGARGGSGAVGTDANGGNGENGTPAPVENPTALGFGGKGELGSTACTPGNNGSDGLSGTPAASVEGPGTLTANGYLPTNGNAGQNGKPGQGGGGGGGAKSPLSCSSEFLTIPAGASGGGGGSGGCGGNGGNPGQGGGASLALALVNSPVIVIRCSFTSANGGSGGSGGLGQGGGVGGSPGDPGAGKGSGKPACSGGKGGNGGSGSAGGGGAGGDSAAIGYVGAIPDVDNETQLIVKPTSRASGGLDGNGPAGAAPGGQGYLGKTLHLKEPTQ
jgi:hypothetical protein